MPICQGKLSNGDPCPKLVEEGKIFCNWHDPDDQTWREIYERLERASPDERTSIALALIENHPEHFLKLPRHNGVEANLRGAVFSEVDLHNANLSQADLAGATLADTNLEDADLSFANLEHATLTESNLQNAYMLGANLERAYLPGAFLRYAYLTDANLQDADIHSANLKEVNLDRANLKQANISGSILKGARLRFANLQNANLSTIDIQDADLSYAHLQNANLSHANLKNAKFDHANLEGANLRYAILQGVDFRETEEVSGIYIAEAWLDKTRLNHEQISGGIGEELERNYAGAKRGYLILKQNFDDLGEYEAASWAYCKERRMEKLESRKNGRYIKYFGDLLVEWLCNYGESVWRVLGWMAFLLFVAGPLIFSWLGRSEWSTNALEEYNRLSLPLQQFVYRYTLYLSYSLDALTTANFSGLQPINLYFKFASGLYAITGIFLVGLLGFVAGNRIRRS